MTDKTNLQLFAPMSGPVIRLEEVPDPVFAEKMVGDGIAIDPTTSTVLAPISGRIVQIHPSNHAITIESAEGVQVLLHIGLDTVKLKGEGFTPHVKTGDRVEKGQALIDFDADLLARKAKSLMSLIIIAEPAGYRLGLPKAQSVIAGKDILLDLIGSEKQARTASPTAGAGQEKSQPFAIRLETGLHARPAAQLVALAKKFTSKVEIQKNQQRANAKSVVSVLGLEIGHGDTVQFVAEGADAAQAVRELEKFLSGLEEKPSAPAPKPIESQRSVRRQGTENVVVGVAASPGLAIGRVHQIQAETFDIKENATDIAEEKARFHRALRVADDELQDLKQQVKHKTDASQAAIFAAHQELLEDPDLIQMATETIDRGKTAEFAWSQATSTHADRLANLNNELMANRANDLRDVGRRVLRILVGKSEPNVTPIASDVILIAENLTPSDTAKIDRNKVLGFCTTTGGATSHVAILARSLGLPAIAGIEARALEIPNGTEIILDGDQGEIRLHPSSEEKQTIQAQQHEQNERRREALLNAGKSATTRDGHTIEVAANIGGVADAQKAVEMGCDGVGLLRSEFLFLGRTTAPTEEEQYQVYQEIADILGERPLVIRTLDVGGDKPLQYLPIPEEENPFLGVRGVRVGLQNPELLREQVRAILRVKTKGTLNIMFPMVALLEEFREAKTIVEEERLRLGAPPVQVGIMIEVPSAALMADVFAREADFFSIGTNDLTQYTLAMDRGHQALAKQVDGLHPSVLKLIEMTVQAAHRYGKWVGVCGGIASDPKAVPVLLGLGVDELSVSIPVIPLVKSQVREASLREVQAVAQEALISQGAKEVRELENTGIGHKRQGNTNVDSENVVRISPENR